MLTALFLKRLYPLCVFLLGIAISSSAIGGDYNILFVANGLYPQENDIYNHLVGENYDVLVVSDYQFKKDFDLSQIDLVIITGFSPSLYMEALDYLKNSETPILIVEYGDFNYSYQLGLVDSDESYDCGSSEVEVVDPNNKITADFTDFLQVYENETTIYGVPQFALKEGTVPLVYSLPSAYEYAVIANPKKHIVATGIYDTRNFSPDGWNLFDSYVTSLLPPKTFADSYSKGVNTSPPQIPEVNPTSTIKDLSSIMANNRGSAEMFYAFDLPPAINGFTPNLSLKYSSSLQFGNAGIGWSMQPSSISIDTSKGIPDYICTDQGIDNLLLDGKELVFWKHSPEGDLYRMKVDDHFLRILYRQGASFKVSHPDGTTSYFGITDKSRLSDPNNRDRVVQWYLEKEVDLSGNTIEYIYHKNKENSRSVSTRLSEIRYGNGYKVYFSWLDQEDTRLDGRPGFFVKRGDLLGKISVVYYSFLKEYELNYVNAPFYGKLLDTITEFSGKQVVNKHKFSYNKLGFNYDEFWKNDFNGTALDSDSVYFSEVIDYPGDAGGDGESTTMKWGANKFSEEKTHVGYIDINGDDLPDIVTRRADQYEISLNTGSDFKPFDKVFVTNNGPPCPLYSVENLSHKHEPNVYDYTRRVLNVIGNYSYLASDLVDINGDGFKDIVDACGEGFSVRYSKNGNFSAAAARYFLPFEDWTDSLEQLPYFFQYSSGVISEMTRKMEASSLGISLGWVDEDEPYSHVYSRLLDMNGDNLPDRILFDGDQILIQINKDYEFISSSAYSSKMPIESLSTSYGAIEHHDVKTRELDPTGNFVWVVWDMWDFDKCTHNEIVDINGDSLPDMVFAGKGPSYLVELNNGLDFVETTVWNNWVYDNSNSYTRQCVGREHVYATSYEGDTRSSTQLTLIDMNNDGLVDRVFRDKGIYVQINNGNSFMEPVLWKSTTDLVDIGHTTNNNIPQESGIPASKEYKVISRTTHRIVDCNGDGYPDVLEGDFGGRRCKVNGLSKLNLLNSIENTITNTTTYLSYDRQFISVDPARYNNYKTINVLARVDKVNNKSTPPLHSIAEYSYSKGILDRAERKFRGFKVVKETSGFEGANVYRVHTRYFHNDVVTGKDGRWINETYDPYLDGKIYREKTDLLKFTYSWGSSNAQVFSRKTISLQEYDWKTEKIIDGNDEIAFVYPEKTYSYIYDEDGSCLYEKSSSSPKTLKCNKPITITSQFNFDRETGLITDKTISNNEDPALDIDDSITKIEYWLDDFLWIMKAKKIERSIPSMVLTDPAGSGHVSPAFKSWTGAVPDRRFLDVDVVRGILEPTTRKRTIQYDRGKVLSTTDWDEEGNGVTTYYQYDQWGLVKSIRDSKGRVTRIKNELVTTQDVLYGISVVSADGSWNAKYYDYFGRLVYSTDTQGHQREYEYDYKGRIQKIYVNNRQTPLVEYSYLEQNYSSNEKYFIAIIRARNEANKDIEMQIITNPIGEIVQKKTRSIQGDENNWIVSGKLKFDECRRIVGRGTPTKAEYAFPNFGYNDNPMQNETKTAYDDRGRVKEIEDPDGYKMKASYFTAKSWSGHQNDEPFEVMRTLSSQLLYDEFGRSKRVYKDMQGRIIGLVNESTVTGKQQIMRYDYIGENKVKTIDPMGNVYEKYFDNLGRVKGAVDPNTGTKRFYYNDDSSISDIVEEGIGGVNGRKNYTRFIYDNVGRLRAINKEGNNRDVEFIFYDSKDGKLERRNRTKKILIGDVSRGHIANPDVETVYDYGRNSIEKKTIVNLKNKSKEAVVTYHFDDWGRTTAVEYPTRDIGQYFVLYRYNKQGLLSGIGGNDDYISEILYDEQGRRTKVVASNGVNTNLDYYEKSGFLRERHITNGNVSFGKTIKRETFFRDEIGNIMRIENEDNSVEHFGYDYLNRLVDAKLLSDDPDVEYHQNYEIDLSNRFMEIKQNENITNYNYDGMNHRTKSILYRSDTGEVTKQKEIQYDDFGYQKDVLTNDYENGRISARKYTFNNDNTLSAIEEDALQMYFIYNADGNRVYRKTIQQPEQGESIKTESFYFHGLFSERDGEKHIHVSDGQNIIATNIKGVYSDRVIHYSLNQVGSTTLITDKKGKAITRLGYTPYGEDISSWKDRPVERMFTNQIYDKESNLYYYNARYYDPTMGQFISPDPIKSGINHFSYAEMNPIMYNDPTGLQSNPERVGPKGGDWTGDCLGTNCQFTDLSDPSQGIYEMLVRGTFPGAWAEDWSNWSVESGSPTFRVGYPSVVSAPGIIAHKGQYANQMASSGLGRSDESSGSQVAWDWNWNSYRKAFKDAYRDTHETLYGAPYKAMKTIGSLVVGSSITKAIGAPSLGEAATAVWSRQGMANLTMRATVTGALVTVAAKSLFVAGAFEVGIVVGTAIYAGLEEIDWLGYNASSQFK